MNIIEALNWRYATKRMNGRTVPKDKLQIILDAIYLAPSSYGLQPYSIVVIENLELMKKIQPIAYMQPQIVEASVLLVFTAWDCLTQQKIDDYISHVAQVRNVSEDSLKRIKEEISNLLKNTAEENFCWHAKQSSIALGVALCAAALEQIDATPMEGFNSKDLDEVLQLKDRGLRSVAIMALGYRDIEKDHLVNLPKVRRNKEELFISLQSEIGFTASNINKI
jgi:nitroreductase